MTLDVTIITGMSGAGRSEAAHVLEDLGYGLLALLDSCDPEQLRCAGQALLDLSSHVVEARRQTLLDVG